jgi:hypothetical protein
VQVLFDERVSLSSTSQNLLQIVDIIFAELTMRIFINVKNIISTESLELNIKVASKISKDQNRIINVELIRI